MKNICTWTINIYMHYTAVHTSNLYVHTHINIIKLNCLDIYAHLKESLILDYLLSTSTLLLTKSSWKFSILSNHLFWLLYNANNFINHIMCFCHWNYIYILFRFTVTLSYLCPRFPLSYAHVFYPLRYYSRRPLVLQLSFVFFLKMFWIWVLPTCFSSTILCTLLLNLDGSFTRTRSSSVNTLRLDIT